MSHLIKKIIGKLWRLIKRWFGVRREYRITLEGIIFVIITFFIGFAAINTSTNLLYLIMSMMLSFFIISGILSTSTLRKITVKRLAVRHISALENAVIQIEVKNDKRAMHSYSLRVMDYLDTGELVGVSYLSHIAPRSGRTASYMVKFPRRGLFMLSRIRVVSRFPFGFFERAILTKQPQEILVYPQIIDIQPILEASNIDLGEYESGRKGTGHSLHGLREYTTADSARFIHWKVSARSNKIMVREFEKEEKKKVTLLLNNAIPSPIPVDCYESFEQAVIYTASLANYLIGREFQVQLETASGRVPFGVGLSHLFRVMRALALIQLEEKEPAFPKLPTDAESTNIFIHFNPRQVMPSYPPDFAQTIDITKIKIFPSPAGTIHHVGGKKI